LCWAKQSHSAAVGTAVHFPRLCRLTIHVILVCSLTFMPGSRPTRKLDRGGKVAGKRPSMRSAEQTGSCDQGRGVADRLG